MTVKSKMVFDHENSWTEMNMADVKGPNFPPQAVDQMKTIGMDDVVTIQPANKVNIYVIYPRIHSYVSMAIPSSGPQIMVSTRRPPNWARKPWTAIRVSKMMSSSPTACRPRILPFGTRRI